ncbi:hypothetical protein BBK82_11935 [Lentzea guizhouensis]|uniref:Uncharacterized protein n=1 Tax=Lentzea guizhouensis TaxID=1586287 RepID=A0A1B2HG48_9PSEU|nr:hypothetical protein BBK82_11935 [Lentzea guizhouensis]
MRSRRPNSITSPAMRNGSTSFQACTTAGRLRCGARMTDRATRSRCSFALIVFGWAAWSQFQRRSSVTAQRTHSTGPVPSSAPQREHASSVIAQSTQVHGYTPTSAEVTSSASSRSASCEDVRSASQSASQNWSSSSAQNPQSG